MKNPRIYTPQPLEAQQTVALTDSAAAHINRALRMQAGESLILFNGSGGSFQARILSSDKKQVSVFVDEPLPDVDERSLPVHLGQALSRGERMDWAIQKATELGVNEITPLFTQRCEVKLNKERSVKRVQHWQQVAISACEQCGRNSIPTIHAPQLLDHWLSQQISTLKLVLHHRTQVTLASHQAPDSVSLLIGPEGGLTKDEISAAESSGFFPTALGPRVMRTETAPVAALTLLQYLWGDLS